MKRLLSFILLIAMIFAITSCDKFSKNENSEEKFPNNIQGIELLPSTSNFKDITNNFTFPEAITEAYSSDSGFLFRSVGKGRNSDIVIMVGVDTEGKIIGTKIIFEEELKNFSEKVYAEVEGTSGGYTGQTLDTFSLITIYGSTLTSVGYGNAVKAALEAYVIASGK